MKLPLLAPMSQATSPGRKWAPMILNSALESRNLAFSARSRNRWLSLVSQALKKDTGQPSGLCEAGLLAMLWLPYNSLGLPSRSLRSRRRLVGEEVLGPPREINILPEGAGEKEA